MIYDDPDLLREMIAFRPRIFDEFTAPVIEAVRPNVISDLGEFPPARPKPLRRDEGLRP